MRARATASAEPRLRSRRLWIGVLAAIVAVVVLWSAAWFYAPPLVADAAEKAVAQKLGRRLTLGKVEFNPWTLELTLNDVVLAGASADAAPMLEVKRIRADAAIVSLLRLAPVIDAVDIDAPTLRVSRLGDGHYDFDDVLQHLAAAPRAGEPAREPARFAVHNIVVRGGGVDFVDRPLAATHRVRELELGGSVRQLAAVGTRDQGRAAPRLRARRQPLRLGRRGDAVRRARQRRDPPPLRRLFGRALARLRAARTAGAAARGDARRRPRRRLRAAAEAVAQGLGHASARAASKWSTPRRPICSRWATSRS